MRPKSFEPSHRPLALILLFIGLCLGLQAWLALAMEVNWDEFYYLSHIYDYQRGELAIPLQSFQVHILGWVTAIPGDEIDQIEAGRLFMLGCFSGTCGLVYVLARAFVSRTGALIAVLVFASAGFSIIHGASFRADPLSALLIMGALVVIARAPPRLGPMVAAGALAAIAAMVTVKVVLYAPAFAGVGAWRVLKSEDRRATLFWLGGAGLAAAVSFVLLYLVQLGLTPRTSTEAARSSLGNAAETQLTAGFLPRLGELLRFVALSPAQTILLVTGAVAAAAMLRDRGRRTDAIAILACGAIVLCLIFYRNAFPYFFPFILAPAAILAGVSMDSVATLRKHVLIVAAALVVPAVLVASTWSRHGQAAQQQVISEVHDIFPRPVPYIDRNSMIATFPKRGFFMSTWGMQNYRRADAPVFEQTFARDTIPLVIVNGPALLNAFGGLPDLPQEYSLLEQDKAALRHNYIPHWGPLWVAGKKLRGQVGGTPFDIRIPGTYTIEGGSASIDGRAFGRGETIELLPGRHLMHSAAAEITLRWGEHLVRPKQPFTGPIYRGF